MLVCVPEGGTKRTDILSYCKLFIYFDVQNRIWCSFNQNNYISIIILDILVMLASVPLLLVTFLVYICLPELRNLHGKCLLGYLMSMAIGYTCLALVKINGEKYVKPWLCKSVGFVIYFLFLSAFFWSNVISFDLWWNFK